MLRFLDVSVASNSSRGHAQGSIRTLLGHTLCVSSVAWPTPYNIYSGSWDHSLRQWDVETGIATRVMVPYTGSPALRLCKEKKKQQKW